MSENIIEYNIGNSSVSNIPISLFSPEMTMEYVDEELLNDRPV